MRPGCGVRCVPDEIFGEEQEVLLQRFLVHAPAHDNVQLNMRKRPEDQRQQDNDCLALLSMDEP